MAYRMTKTWKDFLVGSKHEPVTRRDFLKRGLATGAMSVALPKMFGVEFIKAAHAGTMNCIAPMKNPGAIAQIYSSGGPTMGARFIGDAQAAAMNPTMATNYGITGAPGNFIKLGSGVWVDKTSVFGMTLMAGPPGFPGGAAGWQSKVLNQNYICGGGHLGPFNLDDGVGVNTGLVGSASLDKNTLIGKDVYFTSVVRAPWTNGTPAAYANATTASLVNSFSLSPAAAGNTSAAEMTNAANGASGLAQALSTSFNTASRKGGSGFLNTVGCSFFGNSALTDPTFGSNLFTATGLSPLSSNITLSTNTDQENALLSAFYQSATGVIGGVFVTYGGRDYHSAAVTNPQENVLPADFEDARTVVMFLAACYAAQQPGVLVYNSNGQAIGAGTAPVTTTLNGVNNVAMTSPIAHGDAGGHYNAGLMLFYSPTGNLPVARYTGTILTDSGDVVTDPNVASYQNAMAGLFLTAQKYIGGGSSSPAYLSLLQRVQKMGLVPIADNVTLI